MIEMMVLLPLSPNWDDTSPRDSCGQDLVGRSGVGRLGTSLCSKLMEDEGR